MNPRTDTDLDHLEAKHLKQNPQGSLGTSPSIERLDKPAADMEEKSGPKRWAETARNALQGAKESVSEFSGRQKDHVAEGGNRVSEYFREHDADDIKAEVRHVTREHPAAVLGSLVALGFVLGLALRPSHDS